MLGAVLHVSLDSTLAAGDHAESLRSSSIRLEDGTVRIWHGSTYRLEAVLSVSLSGVFFPKA